MAIHRLVTLNLAVGLAALSLCGCTIVELHGAERVVRVEPGVLRIEPRDDAGMIALRSKGLGLIPSVSGMSLGYREDVVAIVNQGDSCRIVIFAWPEDPQAAAHLLKLIEASDDICSTQGD